jgi:hypothetical protein
MPMGKPSTGGLTLDWLMRSTAHSLVAGGCCSQVVKRRTRRPTGWGARVAANPTGRTPRGGLSESVVQ